MIAATRDRCDVDRAITLVTPGFAPATGGVEMHTSAIATELARCGFDVEVLTAHRGVRRATETVHRGCRVVTYPTWPVRTMSVSPQLVRAAIRRRRAGRIVHVHSYHASTSLVLLGGSGPVVFTPHYHGSRGHSKTANVLHIGFRHVGKLLFRRCDAVICVSEAERRALVADYPNLPDNISVIPNGVAAEAIRKSSPLSGEPATVLCVGRLEPYKRIDKVIRSFVDVPAPAQLVIVGDGSQREELDRLSTALGLRDRVRRLGVLDDADLHRWLRTADVFVSLSEREAFGIAPLEAASGGARPILSDIPAHREVASAYLRDRAIILAEPSPQELAAEIRRQLAGPRCPPADVPEWSEVAKRTATVYRSVIRDGSTMLSGNNSQNLRRPDHEQ